MRWRYWLLAWSGWPIRPHYRFPKKITFGGHMNIRKLAAMAGGAVVLSVGIAQAQVPQYGANITLDQARKAAAAAEAEAKKNSWPMAIAVVDTSGQLVHFSRSDNTQTASVAIAQDKAVSAAMYRRPTKVMQDAVAGGGAGIRFLNLRGASTVEGGLPLYIDGKIVGAIGVSGMASDQDGVCAKAGVDSLSK
jgi:glc operon protein GlcG